MKKLIMGIDGGGTKSHLAVFDQDGQCVVVGKHGPLNHESMEGSFEQLEPELSSFIISTLAKINATPADVTFAVMGIAGVDTVKQHKIISAMVDRVGLPHYILCNDAFLGVPGACPDGIGICAINGTGSTMAAIDHSGATVQICGIGGLSNDCGGGSWYGPELLGAVYGELFKCEKKTVICGLPWLTPWTSSPRTS
jgi:N-acetylglucosamine kinase-like BadF-type ATPase